MSHFWFLLLYQAATFHLDLANTTFEGKNTMKLCDEHDFYCSGRYRMCGWRFYWWFVRQALTMASVLVSFLLAPVRQKPDKSQQRCVIQKDTLKKTSKWPCWLSLATPDLTTILEDKRLSDVSGCEQREQGRNMEEDGGEGDGTGCWRYSTVSSWFVWRRYCKGYSLADCSGL